MRALVITGEYLEYLLRLEDLEVLEDLQDEFRRMSRG